MQLTRTHRILIGVVVAGAVVIAGIGFAGSYAAVRELAEEKGFGDFSVVFPIGVDAGICVLLALDLLLTWLRIPFPLLRQTAWLLTAATIAFNAAAAWPDPLGVGMHAVIPVLFVVAVEAARHAVGRIADITADKHMEGVRLTRWLLSPIPTFKLWRRMKLWELRSYEQVIKLEQERLVYQARLQARFGRGWRRKAPVESLMPLRLARYGVPLAETAPAGLAAAGIDPVLLPPAPAVSMTKAPEATKASEGPQQPQLTAAPESGPAPGPAQPQPGPRTDPRTDPQTDPQTNSQSAAETPAPEEALPVANHASPWFAAHNASYAPVAPYDEWYAEQERQQAPDGQDGQGDQGDQGDQQAFPVPNGAGGTRPLGEGGTPQQHMGPVPAPAPSDEDLYQVFRHSIEGEGMPTPGAFAANAEAAFGLRLQSRELNNYMDRFSARLENELMEDHIA
ncbi:DUF2637 domain-containing protein [Streptomyces sp. Je 1-369]|uniref:DUF2637 domain-containing protein n=1 Tax=Streptomyces sp. Je 1-369 TaxID=2966192 RepID=UPI002286A282|nr:DUF2637 domain-containing protein [Streptomyces sp. Je 1-369]WAL97113.1 DUF2637 domain-containing protein [Streptomyces sp. Je 1-369]